MSLFLKIVAARRARESVKAAPQPQQQAQACIAKEIPDQAAITRASSWAGHLLQAVAPRWRDLHSRLQRPMRWDSACTGLGGEFAAAVQLGLPLDSQAHMSDRNTWVARQCLHNYRRFVAHAWTSMADQANGHGLCLQVGRWDTQDGHLFRRLWCLFRGQDKARLAHLWFSLSALVRLHESHSEH